MVMWSRPLYHCRIIVVYYNLIYYILSTPASPAFFTISDTTADSSAAFPFFYLTDWISYCVFVYWARYTGNCICLGQTIPVPCKLCVEKLFMIVFQSSFLFSSIKILLSNNILISFDHPLCNLKHIAFVIISLYNVFKSFPFCFLHLAWQTVSLAVPTRNALFEK